MAERKSSVGAILVRLIALLSQRQRRQLAGLFVMMMLGAVLEMFGIGAIPAFAALLGSPERVLNNPIIAQHLPILRSLPQSRLVLYSAIGLLAVFIVKNIYLFVLLVAQATFTQRLQARLAVRVLRAY